MRSSMEKMLSIYSLPKSYNKKPVRIDHIYGEWFEPKGEFHRKKVILYLHGGGYALGSCNTHRGLVSHIANMSKITCLLIEYGLAPEKPFPQGLNDAIRSYKWLLSKGYEPNDIVLMGDSAGGGLALSTFLAIKERKLPIPNSIVCFSPWTNLNCDSESFMTNKHFDRVISQPMAKKMAKHYIGSTGRSLSDPLVSPLFGDYTDAPNILTGIS